MSGWGPADDFDQAPAPDDATTGGGDKPKPVFGSMFAAGLAAVSAAAAGRLGMPRVLAWATRKDPAKDGKAAIDGVDKLAGGAGGGIGGLAGGIGGPPVPAAHAGMLGAAPPPALPPGMPMMPFMPFAPMGFDMAGARRIPPWLVETEEVWGESIITPPVIGEEPPEEPDPSTGFRF